VALAALPLRPEAVLPTLLGLAWALVQGAPTPPRDWEASDVTGTERGREEAVAVDVSREFSLTERESQVLRAAVRGLSTKAIAGEICVSTKAIEYYWRRIFSKLGCHAQLEVMALLLRRASRIGRTRRSPAKR
jgi:DNA-binding CsgD family transcriptional regulator